MGFEPVNEIEELLLVAATEPERRAEFAQKLLDSEICIALFGETPDQILVDPETNSIMEGTKLQAYALDIDGVQSWPFFTSPERVWAMTDDSHIVTPGQTRSFFESNKGDALVLNPGSEYAKQFLPGEVEDMLAGRTDTGLQTTAIEQDTSVMVGSPANPPDAFMDELKRAFAHMPDIERAYMPMVAMESEDPRLMLEVLTGSDRDVVSQKLQSVIEASRPPEGAIDLHIADSEEGLIAKGTVKPFYTIEKSETHAGKKSWLKRLFS